VVWNFAAFSSGDSCPTKLKANENCKLKCKNPAVNTPDTDFACDADGRLTDKRPFCITPAKTASNSDGNVTMDVVVAETETGVD
jgi:hypothetical protein